MMKTVERILYFNQLNQEGQGIKTLTASQVFSKLAISLARVKVGNNSEEFQIEIRQLVYSLYRSKKLTQTIDNNLINTI